MKNIFSFLKISLLAFLIYSLMGTPVFSKEQDIDLKLENDSKIQSRINSISSRILNSNKIDKRIIFVYSNLDKKAKLELDSKLSKRQVRVYSEIYSSIEDDNELAAFLSREIFIALKSYDGVANGFLTSLQISAAPKKYEIAADKKAVDYMVKANYNPIALITHLNKTSPQKRFDRFSNHNLTSKRLAIIYEYIYYKYPYYLKNNEYISNENYQNFLLNSQSNRKLLEEKIKSNSREKLKYE